MNVQSILEQRAKVEEFQRRHRIGLVTLLFTDLVGSTRLKQELGDRDAVQLIQRHHTLLREILSQFHEGEEIETAGDSFFLVFAKPSDAVRFSLVFQSRLRELSKEAARPLLDRIGLHVGEVVIEERPDTPKPKTLYGLQVDICARVTSLAEGDQILMTRSTFDNARQVLKGHDIEGLRALSWLNHGPYLMKGVEEALEICEVGEVGRAALKPPPDSDKVHRYISPGAEPVLGWRPAVEQVVPNTGWMLERELGSGGFGEVWLGRHEKLKERRVFKFCFHADRVRSLKREVTLFRLLKERGNHPNIVGIQDVFFDEPPFYIMMDYAEGEDLAKWADRQGGLDKVPLEVRLEIVAQVAHALQAAHEAGIIHRDVKPSNIIVCGSYPDNLQVKLTDFGIGQVVSKDVLSGVTQMGFTQTMYGSSATGTPMYMAPELHGGKAASTRSDIYSLGVVLYQLVAGDLTRPPTMDWARDIESTLLKEDMSKCLAGNPQERFAGAQELAHRIRTLPGRKLEHARREAEISEKVRKAHRKGVMRATAVATGVVLLTAGLAIWAIHQSSLARSEAERAKAAENVAKQRLADSEAISKFMTEVFQSPDPARAGRTVTVAETLGRASTKLDTELTDQPARQARLQATLGLTYYKLGLYPEAIALQEKARTYYLAAAGPEDPETLWVENRLANSYSEAGRINDALELREKVVALRRKVLGPENADTLTAMNNLATSYKSVGRTDDAIKLQEAALPLCRKVLGPDSGATLLAMANLAMSYDDAGRLEEAIKMQEEVLTRSRKVFGPDQPRTIDAMSGLADAYEQAGRHEEALKLHEDALTLCRKVFGPEHPATIGATQSLANSYFSVGRRSEALKMREDALALSRRTLGPEHPRTIDQMGNLAASYYEAGRMREAVKLFEDAAALSRKVLGPENPGTVSMVNNLAWVLATSEAPEIRDGTKAVSLAEEAVAVSHRKDANYLETLAAAYAEAQQFEKAVAVMQEAIGLTTTEQGKKDMSDELKLYQEKKPNHGKMRYSYAN